jgi:hypothetical protein
MKTNESKLKRGPVIGKQELHVLIFTKMAGKSGKPVLRGQSSGVSAIAKEKVRDIEGV